jgi:NTP pyrophosphatase (non-canonical NTP hydrolase)
MELRALQQALGERYAGMDREAGLPFLLSVMQEEVGELARAVRKGQREDAGKEAVDVLFMALSVCNVLGFDAEAQLRAKFLERPMAEVTRSWEDLPAGRRERG